MVIRKNFESGIRKKKFVFPDKDITWKIRYGKIVEVKIIDRRWSQQRHFSIKDTITEQFSQYFFFINKKFELKIVIY